MLSACIKPSTTLIGTLCHTCIIPWKEANNDSPHLASDRFLPVRSIREMALEQEPAWHKGHRVPDRARVLLRSSLLLLVVLRLLLIFLLLLLLLLLVLLLLIFPLFSLSLILLYTLDFGNRLHEVPALSLKASKMEVCGLSNLGFWIHRTHG